MKPKTLILMVVAVTCGLGASYMTSRLLADRQPENEEKVAVLVAKKNLDQGLTIKNVDDHFHVKLFVRGSEPKDALLNAEELKSRVLRRSLRADDHVTAPDLLSAEQSGISHLMAQGFRAFGIRMSIQDVAAGFACTPLSRIDLIWTVRRATDKDSFSQTLLENVLVLAADQNTQRDENGRPMPANVVTVALKPEDCQKVAMAREMGTISFVLRKFNDVGKSEFPKTTVEEIITGSAGKKDIEENSWTENTQQPPTAQPILPKLDGKKETPIQVAEAAPAPKGKLHQLQIIEGDRIRVVEYWLGEDNEVIQSEVRRTELTPANPPRPPQVQTPPQEPTPAAPAVEPK